MKEEVEIIYLLARRGLKWVRGHGRWFRLMEGRGLRGRLVANGNRKPWVSIKPPVPLFCYRFIEVVTAMDCCPGDLTLLHKACLLSRAFPAGRHLFYSIRIHISGGVGPRRETKRCRAPVQSLSAIESREKKRVSRKKPSFNIAPARAYLSSGMRHEMSGVPVPRLDAIDTRVIYRGNLL